MRRIWCALVASVMLAAFLAGSAVSAAPTEVTTKVGGRYVALARAGVPSSRALRAIRAAGATVLDTNAQVGLSTVRATGSDFGNELMRSGLFTGVARDRVVGRSPRSFQLHRLGSRSPDLARRYAAIPVKGGDPLARFQWNMNMVDANFGRSYSVDRGDPRVLVGIMDTGLVAKHPDIKANLDREMSRNFTTDMPAIDGPCRAERDRSCDDSPLTDPNGHGTWVGSTVAAPLNGFGMSGVAPEINLVNLRVMQDSGYAFLQPTVDALTYAADNGIDVVNMSYFVDPWLFNCASNPADPPEAQLEQQTIIAAVQEAVDYARDRGVTLVGALGNMWTDLDSPTVDPISPTFPFGTEYEREIDDSCLTLPAEAEGVIGVSGVGPSGRKAWYGNYGLEATSVAAPAGDDFDATLPYFYNMPLGAWSAQSLREFDLLNKEGKPKVPEVLRRCTRRGKCFYYLHGAGTSFAAPIATGVAALIVGRFGAEDGAGGLALAPDEVERILYETSEPHPCPEGGVQEYPEIGDTLVDFGLPSWEAYTATCEEGPGATNGFYGHGIVNAYNAVTYQQ